MLFSEYKQVKGSIRKIKKRLFQNNKFHSEVEFIVSRRVPIAALPHSYHQRTPLARYLHIKRRDRQQLRFLTFREFYFTHIISSRHLKDQPINIWTIRFHNIISQTICIVTIMMMDAKSRQQFDSQFLPESFAATIVFLRQRSFKLFPKTLILGRDIQQISLNRPEN